MKQLRVVLLNQYIGAIAIGLLIARSVDMFLGALMPAFNALLTQLLTGTTLGRDYWNGAVRGAMISNVVLTGMYLLIAYFFSSWLYARPAEKAESNGDSE